MTDISVEQRDGIALVEIGRPPNNFLDIALVRDLAESLELLDADPAVRCLLLCTQGKNFCAGANFASAVDDGAESVDPGQFYIEALRLFRLDTPIVAAVQGAAVGAGLGLALAADFRVASAESRFTANFNRLGIHPGFGLSVTLPRLVGVQQAAMLFYTGRRITGSEAQTIGLVDLLVEDASLRSSAFQLAEEIASSAPLAVTATRRTLRRALADDVTAAVDHEMREQRVQFATADFKEGVRAMTERRPPRFTGA